MSREFKGAHGQTPPEYAHEELLDAPECFRLMRKAFNARDEVTHERTVRRLESQLAELEQLLASNGRAMRQVRQIMIREWIGADGPATYQRVGAIQQSRREVLFESAPDSPEPLQMRRSAA